MLQETIMGGFRPFNKGFARAFSGGLNTTEKPTTGAKPPTVSALAIRRKFKSMGSMPVLYTNEESVLETGFLNFGSSVHT